jgi:RNA polymerase sigma-70 factor, ECF subfamily
MDNDVFLLNAAKMMNKDALTKIFDLYAHPLFNFALRLCGDPTMADHIVGDVFAKLLEQLACGKGPKTNLRSYLYETAYHLVVDEARDSRRQIPVEVIHVYQDDKVSVSTRLENRLLFEAVLRAIQNDLTDDQRHVVILRFLEGFSLLETSKIMGKAVSHVKVIQNRAIAALRKEVNRKKIAAIYKPHNAQGIRVRVTGD